MKEYVIDAKDMPNLMISSLSTIPNPDTTSVQV